MSTPSHTTSGLRLAVNSGDRTRITTPDRMDDKSDAATFQIENTQPKASTRMKETPNEGEEDIDEPQTKPPEQANHDGDDGSDDDAERRAEEAAQFVVYTSLVRLREKHPSLSKAFHLNSVGYSLIIEDLIQDIDSRLTDIAKRRHIAAINFPKLVSRHKLLLSSSYRKALIRYNSSQDLIKSNLSFIRGTIESVGLACQLNAQSWEIVDKLRAGTLTFEEFRDHNMQGWKPKSER